MSGAAAHRMIGGTQDGLKAIVGENTFESCLDRGAAEPGLAEFQFPAKC